VANRASFVCAGDALGVHRIQDMHITVAAMYLAS
jgi:hypothetical protein